MDSGVNIPGNSFPFLTFVGLDRYDKNCVGSSKEIIVNLNLDYKSLSNGLLLELWSLVETQEEFNKPISDDKITRRQFAEILGCFLFRWSAEEVTRDFVKNHTKPRDFESLKKKVASGAASEHDIWDKGSKLLERIGRLKCKDQLGTNESAGKEKSGSVTMLTLMNTQVTPYLLKAIQLAQARPSSVHMRLVVVEVCHKRTHLKIWIMLVERSYFQLMFVHVY